MKKYWPVDGHYTQRCNNQISNIGLCPCSEFFVFENVVFALPSEYVPSLRAPKIELAQQKNPISTKCLAFLPFFQKNVSFFRVVVLVNFPIFIVIQFLENGEGCLIFSCLPSMFYDAGMLHNQF